MARATWGGKGLFHLPTLRLHFNHWSKSGQELKAETEAEVLEEHCLSLRFAQPAF